MRAGRNTLSGETEIYLSDAETEDLKQIIRGASLPLKRQFTKILEL